MVQLVQHLLPQISGTGGGLPLTGNSSSFPTGWTGVIPSSIADVLFVNPDLNISIVWHVTNLSK